MTSQSKSGPGLLFISRNGGTEKVEDLVGRKFCSIASGEAEVIALCNDGVHAVHQEGVKHISNAEMQLISVGKNFFVACDSSKGLYTWGQNCSSGQVSFPFFTILCGIVITESKVACLY